MSVLPSTNRSVKVVPGGDLYVVLELMADKAQLSRLLCGEETQEGMLVAKEAVPPIHQSGKDGTTIFGTAGEANQSGNRRL